MGARLARRARAGLPLSMHAPTPADGHPPRPSARPGSPSVLDLVRRSAEPVFPPGGESLYRQIARLTEMQPGQVVLDAACGRGISTAFLASHARVEAHGVDPDALLIAEAIQRCRASGVGDRVAFEAAPLDDLPYRDAIFDIAIGEIGLGTMVEPATAIRELARVTRSRGCVVLVQLIWTGHIDEERKETLVQHLGARPLLLMEWKQHLRDAGIVDLHVEDWSDFSSPFRPALPNAPFHDIAAIFSLRQKAAILHRALQRWGWRGVKGAIVREQEIHTLLTRQRVLGLSLIKGTKWE